MFNGCTGVQFETLKALKEIEEKIADSTYGNDDDFDFDVFREDLDELLNEVTLS